MKLFKNILPVFIFGFCLTGLSFAQTSYSLRTTALKLDLPAFDFPYQIEAMDTLGSGFFSSYANPGMRQSLALTADLFSGFHFGMKALNHALGAGKIIGGIIYYGGIAAGDWFLFKFPGAGGWLHEEYHRSVMTRFGVNSFNEINTFPLDKSMIKVMHITDGDLERFKAESPADFIRMQAAGIEGESLLVDRLQRNNFFYNENLFNEFYYWMTLLNSHIYVMTASIPSWVDAEIDRMNLEDTDIASRDFTGYDMIGWTYDLFRPNEAYSARGPHPSGVGINRYRKTTDLRPEELDYLRTQGYWQFLNYVSPMMFGFRSIALGDTGFAGNFALRHRFTSFGTDLSLTVFLKQNFYNFVLTYHNYQNYRYSFPAIDLELVDYPLFFRPFGLYVSGRFVMGLQPYREEFRTSRGRFFGLLSGRVDLAIQKNWLPYLEICAKTEGWVAGNEYLGRNISAAMGVSARF